MAADRIDLFARRGPFILTPFLVLAPLTISAFLLRMGWDGNLRVSIVPPIHRQRSFLIATAIFMFLTLLSIPFGLDPQRGLVSYCDLLLVVVLGYGISVLIILEPEREKLIVVSITFGLIAYVLFCVGEYIAWSHGLVIVQNQEASSWMEWTFAPQPLGPFGPRLAGTTFDANRSGFILTMYLILLDNFAAKSRYATAFRYAIAFLVLLTLSRSAILCWLVYYLFSRKFWKALASRRAKIFLAVICATASLLIVVYPKEIGELVDAWKISDIVSAKMSMDPGSSGESHVLLIQRGIETWSRSAKTIAIGIGFNSGPQVLTDLLGDSKYINFHSLYATVLAELGLPAFLVMMFIIGVPAICRKGAFPCVLAIMVFNVSYQSHMEPMFWAILALLWSFDWKCPPGLHFLAS